MTRVATAQESLQAAVIRIPEVKVLNLQHGAEFSRFFLHKLR
jgi:hypothetical protein